MSYSNQARSSRYQSNNQFGRSGGQRRFGGNRRFGGAPKRGGRGQDTFDPSLLVRQAEKPVVEKYEAKHVFADFNFHPGIMANIEARGYVSPTPIQDQAIPHILEGRDIIGVANTGTGKTAAFLLPLLHKLMNNTHSRVLIVCPTRELALQIREEMQVFSANMNIFSALCIGGAAMGRQIENLRRNPDVVIGTPGRLKDLEQNRKLHFDEFDTIVLDEVDRMLDMGFIRDVEYMISRLPEEKHALFFSATVNNKMREIMANFLSNPVSVTIKSAPTSVNVNQDVIKMNGQSKIDVLLKLLMDENFEKVIVFGRTKHGADNIARKLQERGVKVAAIHGNKNQGQRERALRQFRHNQLQALVATDVISRGLDIDDVTHVINYDLPQTYEDYIHRIGRTGRANKTGTALTFVD